MPSSDGAGDGNAGGTKHPLAAPGTSKYPVSNLNMFFYFIQMFLRTPTYMLNTLNSLKKQHSHVKKKDLNYWWQRFYQIQWGYDCISIFQQNQTEVKGKHLFSSLNVGLILTVTQFYQSSKKYQVSKSQI